MPGVPTLTEAGLKGDAIYPFYTGAYLPSKTPRATNLLARKHLLVPRTRSSHYRAASPIANFGFKRGTRIIELLVSL